MIGAFLRAEIDSGRCGAKLLALLARDGRDAEVLRRPDLSDSEASAYRRRLLDEHRAYERREGLFDGFPRRIDWLRAALEPAEVLDMLYIDWEWWLELPAARAARETPPGGSGPESCAGMSVDGQEPVAAALRTSGQPELIAVTVPEWEPHVLVEGHYRLTAYALFPEYLPPELEIVLGVSTRPAAGGRSELCQQRAADDGGLGARVRERGDVGRRAHAAGGEHARGPRRRPRGRARGRGRRACRRGRSRCRGRARRRRARQRSTASSSDEPGAFGPAGRAHLAVADVERDREPIAERRDPRRRDRRPPRCRRRRDRRPPRAARAASSSERIPPEAWSAAGAAASATSRTSSGRTRPERAPSRSTRCTRAAPASAKRRASATGSPARSTTAS